MLARLPTPSVWPSIRKRIVASCGIISAWPKVRARAAAAGVSAAEPVGKVRLRLTRWLLAPAGWLALIAKRG